MRAVCWHVLVKRSSAENLVGDIRASKWWHKTWDISEPRIRENKRDTESRLVIDCSACSPQQPIGHGDGGVQWHSDWCVSDPSHGRSGAGERGPTPTSDLHYWKLRYRLCVREQSWVFIFGPLRSKMQQNHYSQGDRRVVGGNGS